MNGHDHEPKEERMIFGKIEEALCRLTCATEEQTAWLKANHGAATKADLKTATLVILDAVHGAIAADDQKLLDGLLARSKSISKKLERLEAQTGQ